MTMDGKIWVVEIRAEHGWRVLLYRESEEAAERARARVVSGEIPFVKGGRELSIASGSVRVRCYVRCGDGEENGDEN